MVRGPSNIVVGGVALVLHGVVRLTADLDLMVHLEEGNLIVSVKNLIKLKEISGRPQDIADIAALKEIEKIGRR